MGRYPPIAMMVIYWHSVMSMSQQAQEACSKTWWPSPGCIVGAEREQLELLWRWRGIFIVVFGPGVFVLLLLLIVGYVIPEYILAPLTWVLRILPRWAKA